MYCGFLMFSDYMLFVFLPLLLWGVFKSSSVRAPCQNVQFSFAFFFFRRSHNWEVPSNLLIVDYNLLVSKYDYNGSFKSGILDIIIII